MIQINYNLDSYLNINPNPFYNYSPTIDVS